MKSQYILSMATLVTFLALTACGGDGDSSDDFVCDVTSTATSVKTYQSVPGIGTYVETGTLRDDKIYFTQEYEYYDAAVAREECKEMKSEYGSWRSVNCSGNTMTVSDYSDTDDIDEYANVMRETCATMKQMFESGDFYGDEDDWDEEEW